MGVYIKDLKKPKGCYECPIAKSYLDCLMEKKYICPIGHTDDCPLIEIDLERDIPTIWYNRQTGQYEPKGTKQEIYERLYKLKYGETRSDDKTEESRP